MNEYTRETLNGTDTYRGYDAAGNLTRVAAAEGNDTDGDWRITRRGDSRGGPATAGYDYANFMTKAQKYDTDAWVTQAEFARDALGRRIEKVAAGTTYSYYYDDIRAIEETEGTGTPTVERQYVFGNGIDEALLLFDKNGETYDAYYYLSAPLWTVEALVDENASIVEAYAYTAYGAPTIKTGDGGDGDWFDGDETTSTTSAYANPILFTGREWNPQIALYHFRARTSDPLTGRFLQRDPIGYADGMNLYHAYFAPGRIDPTGHQSGPGYCCYGGIRYVDGDCIHIRTVTGWVDSKWTIVLLKVSSYVAPPINKLVPRTQTHRWIGYIARRTYQFTGTHMYCVAPRGVVGYWLTRYGSGNNEGATPGELTGEGLKLSWVTIEEELAGKTVWKYKDKKTYDLVTWQAERTAENTVKKWHFSIYDKVVSNRNGNYLFPGETVP